MGASVLAEPDGTVSFLATTLASAAASPTIQYRFDFIANATMEAIPIQIMPVDWSAGQDYAEVTANLAVDGGVWQWILFMETNQPVNLANVTAVEGSALVTVELSGDVDVGSPVLKMAMAGNYMPTAELPGLAEWWAQVLLALAIVATGVMLYRFRMMTGLAK